MARTHAGATVCALLLAALISGRPPAGDAAAAGLHPTPRQPVALALATEGRWLFVANRQSGSVSVIDTASLQVTAEMPIGRRLADLDLAPDGEHLVVADEEAGELVLLRRRGGDLTAVGRAKVAAGPVSVRFAADGSLCTAVSLWPRLLTVVRLAPPRDVPQVRNTIALPFAGRAQLPLPGGKLVVADSFGGRLAVVDLNRGEVESDRTLPAHNIRGLALTADGRRLLVSHQLLNGQATTSGDDVHWGNLLANGVRELPLGGVLDRTADPLRDSRLHRLGEIGRGAGDPAGVATAPDGKVVVALAGVGEVAVAARPGGDWQRIAVGRRPTAVAVSPDGRRAYVANTHADTISVLNLEENRRTADVLLGTGPDPTPAERGERLFYDARLSKEGWFSCHSCHTDGHSNGQLADTLTDGSYGTPKRVLSLLGVADSGPWAWNGGVKTLGAMVRRSVQTTMRGKLSAGQENDLVAYLQTLRPPPPRNRLRETSDADAVRRGRESFGRRGCGDCHAPPTYTSAKA
ncbi:MAG TPA: YncE family protein, partial [Gemmataceae bacterium]